MGFNSNSQRKLRYHGRQLTMRDMLVVDPGPHLKAAMSEAIKESDLSREQIVDEMNRLAKICGIACNGKSRQVTAALLDKWVAPGATAYQIPLRLLPLFCRAVGSNLPLEVYASAFIDVRLVSMDEYRMLEWAKAEIEFRLARRKSRKIAQEVGIE
ncbi:MAG TPA: hypothetical protein PLM79_17945 [Syntrophobacteraceae bacterium]|nr:hypothetical protein [Syntrophobacteraceae bacterium]